MSAMRPDILVLGVGNILMRDEGIGVRVVEALSSRCRFPPDVELLDGGTAGMDLVHAITGRRHLIVCDAVISDEAAGSVMRIADDAVPAYFQTKLSPHQVGLCDVLATLKLLGKGPDTVTIIGVVPAEVDLGTELSPLLTERLDAAAEMVLQELHRLGRGAGAFFDAGAQVA